MDKIKKNKKEKILDVAGKVFGKKGYWKTDIETIASMTKLGKGTIYLYFKNKEELFLAVIDRVLDTLSSKMKEEVSSEKNIIEKIKKAIYVYLEFFEKHFPYFNIILHENPGFKIKVSERFWKRFWEKFDIIENDFKIGISKGLIKNIPIKDAIFALIGMLHGVIHQWILSGRKYPLKKKSYQISKLFLEGIKK